MDNLTILVIITTIVNFHPGGQNVKSKIVEHLSQPQMTMEQCETMAHQLNKFYKSERNLVARAYCFSTEDGTQKNNIRQLLPESLRQNNSN